jgi:beta-glucanase (GH16 family)
LIKLKLQFYTDKNARTENGNLIIETKRESFSNRQYTSSRLISTKTFKYGVFEMRAKLPKGLGTWVKNEKKINIITLSTFFCISLHSGC